MTDFKYPQLYSSQTLITLFNQLFSQRYKTHLVGGGQEPFYQAAKTDSEMHQLIFRNDYFASALHEIAHWCLAGAERRKEDDFGYWYVSEGRDIEQQRAFFDVEVKPQALECIFTRACRLPFQVSVDNHCHQVELREDIEHFKQRVDEQVDAYLKYGMPKRAKMFTEALHKTFFQEENEKNLIKEAGHV